MTFSLEVSSVWATFLSDGALVAIERALRRTAEEEPRGAKASTVDANTAAAVTAARESFILVLAF